MNKDLIIESIILDIQIAYLDAQMELGKTGEEALKFIFTNELESFAQKEANVEVKEFAYVDMDIDVCGSYNHVLNRIKINENLLTYSLTKGEAKDLLNIIDTYCHECKHAWQASHGYNFEYIPKDYFNDPIEIEARRFAERVLNNKDKISTLLKRIHKKMEEFISFCK